MKRATFLSNEEKQELIDRYKNGENIKDLCAEYDIDLSTGYMWLRKAGVSTKRKMGKRVAKKVCRKCGHAESNPKACFCSMCGSKMKTEADLLIDDLHYIAELTQFLPQSTRDKTIATVNKTVAYIRAAEKERAKNGNGMC